jgi:hypothetical protein
VDGAAPPHPRLRGAPRRGDAGDELRRPIASDDPALADDDLADPHRNRALPGGVQSWSKREHLDRIGASGHFAYAREVVLEEPVSGGPDRFVALMRSQGSYQGLRRRGLDDAELGVTTFERDVTRAFARAGHRAPMSFCWRVRLGVTPR